MKDIESEIRRYKNEKTRLNGKNESLNDCMKQMQLSLNGKDKELQKYQD